MLYRYGLADTEQWEVFCLKVIAAIDKWLQEIYDYLMMFCGMAVAILIVISALLRYIFKIDFYGSEEYTLLVGFWLYFIGSISAARDKSHLSADMITVFTRNEVIIRVFAVVRDVLSLAICILVVSWCWDYFSWQYSLHPVSSVHRIPRVLQQFPMCLSFLLWSFYLIRDCIKAFFALKNARLKGESKE